MKLVPPRAPPAERSQAVLAADSELAEATLRLVLTLKNREDQVALLRLRVEHLLGLIEVVALRPGEIQKLAVAVERPPPTPLDRA